MTIFKFAAALGLLLALVPAPAAAQRGVPSCYAAVHIDAAPPPPARAVFLFVDQTTALDPGLAASVRRNMQHLLVPGTAFTVASFSFFGPGHYATVLASGTLEQTVPAPLRPGVSSNGLLRLDACLRQQGAFATQVALAAFAGAVSPNPAIFSQSEILASLRHLSAAVAAARVRDRVVIVASDMLEHSSATSFYRARALRLIDPAAELNRAAALGLFANFAGARVYVIGAGILPPQPGGNGRTIPALNALEAFWTLWLHRSNARLAGYGHPDLATPIP